MPQTPNATPSSSTQNSRLSQVEGLIGFVTFSAVSVGAVFVLAGAVTSCVDHMMRYGVFELSQAIGGVI